MPVSKIIDFPTRPRKEVGDEGKTDSAAGEPVSSSRDDLAEPSRLDVEE